MVEMTELTVSPADSTTGRVVQVLLAFSEGSQLLGITEIARSTGLSKAVVHRILQELGKSELVVQHRETRKYMLGNGAFALSNNAAAQSKLRSTGMSVIASLSEDTGETTTLSARVGHRRIYLGQIESTQLIRISVQVGLSLPLSVGASGHAMLAFLPTSEAEEILKRPVPAANDRTETRPGLIRDRLDRIRESGYARTDSERVAESVSFAAPVFGSTGEVVGSISIAAMASRVDTDREANLSRRVIEAAEKISNQLHA